MFIYVNFEKISLIKKKKDLALLQNKDNGISIKQNNQMQKNLSFVIRIGQKLLG